MRLFKCLKCGKIIAIEKEGVPSTVCCGQDMVEIKANTEDAAQEKHVPYAEVEGDGVYVRVGEVAHPMEENHYIEWIAAEYSDSLVKYMLKPGEKPEAYFDFEKGMKIYAYCNLHGLWKKEL